eukprot:6212919-Pleurochrysis_carterae.AAC.4
MIRSARHAGERLQDVAYAMLGEAGRVWRSPVLGSVDDFSSCASPLDAGSIARSVRMFASEMSSSQRMSHLRTSASCSFASRSALCASEAARLHPTLPRNASA